MYRLSAFAHTSLILRIVPARNIKEKVPEWGLFLKLYFNGTLE